MPVTQKQLAERLGISQMTISSALRGSNVVAPQTRQRILEAAREMGYRLNTSARAMRHGHTGCVAVVESTADYRSSFFGGALLDGIHDALALEDVHVTVSKLTDERLVSEAFIPKILREFTADGLLINYFSDIPQRLVELIDLYRVPAVWINSKQKHNAVYLDDYGGGRRAAQHLLELGHTRIAYADFENSRPRDATERDVVHYSIVDRLRGHQDALRGAGLTSPTLHTGARIPHDQVLAVARAWLGQPDRSTAIVAYSAHSAEALILAAAQLGLRVPEDLSIVGFHDSCQLNCGVKMTTMRHRWALVGETASQMILQLVQDPAQSLTCRAMPFEFRPGQTTAPLRAEPKH